MRNSFKSFGKNVERDMHQKSGKVSFGHIYDLRDPREYYKTLGEMDYRTPEHGQRLFSALVERRSNRSAVNVVDLCCSYGINAALLKYDIVLDDLYERYFSEELEKLSGDELASTPTWTNSPTTKRSPYFSVRHRPSTPSTST